MTQKGEAKMKDESGRPSADKAAAGGGGTVKLGHTLYVGCLTEGVGSRKGSSEKGKGGGRGVIETITHTVGSLFLSFLYRTRR